MTRKDIARLILSSAKGWSDEQVDEHLQHLKREYGFTEEFFNKDVGPVDLMSLISCSQLTYEQLIARRDELVAKMKAKN